MPESRLPVRNPAPDIERWVRVLMGREQTDRPPLVEYIVDPALMRPILTDLLGRAWVQPGPDRASQAAFWDNVIAFWLGMGYDFVRLEIGLPLPHHGVTTRDTAVGVEGNRTWADEHQGMIRTWAEFEQYPWPRLEDVDFFPLEYVNDHLPDGMGLIASHAAGPYEHLSSITSYEGLCWLLADDPDLVQAIADRVGGLMEQFYGRLLQLDRLAVVFPGDDMGFRTATLVSPAHLRQYTLPWHRRFAAMAHERGLPYFLHSCGNTEAIWPDLLDDIRIDGKHSFEDAILPIAQFQARMEGRLAVLGGIDVDVLAVRSPDDVHRYTREVIDACAPRGRFAVGSGNSIPSYIPLQNYLAMVDEALR